MGGQKVESYCGDSPRSSSSEVHQYDLPSLTKNRFTPKSATNTVERSRSPPEGRPLSVLTSVEIDEKFGTPSVQTQREPLCQALNSRVRLHPTPTILHASAKVRRRPALHSTFRRSSQFLSETRWKRPPLLIPTPLISSVTTSGYIAPPVTSAVTPSRLLSFSTDDVAALPYSTVAPISVRQGNRSTQSGTPANISSAIQRSSDNARTASTLRFPLQIPQGRRNKNSTPPLYKASNPVQRNTAVRSATAINRAPRSSAAIVPSARASRAGGLAASTIRRASTSRLKQTVLSRSVLGRLRRMSPLSPAAEPTPQAETQTKRLRQMTVRSYRSVPLAPLMTVSSEPLPRLSPSLQIYAKRTGDVHQQAKSSSAFQCGPCVGLLVFFIVVAVVSLAAIAGQLGVMSKLDQSFYGARAYSGRFRVTKGDFFQRELLDKSSLTYSRRRASYEHLLKDLLGRSGVSDAVTNVTVESFSDDNLTVFFHIKLDHGQLGKNTDDASNTIKEILLTEALSSSPKIFKNLQIDLDSIAVERTEDQEPFGLFLHPVRTTERTSSSSNSDSVTHKTLKKPIDIIYPEVFSVQVGSGDRVSPELALGPYIAASSDSHQAVPQPNQVVLLHPTGEEDQLASSSNTDLLFSASSNSEVVRPVLGTSVKPDGSDTRQVISGPFTGSDLLNKEVLAESAQIHGTVGSDGIVYPPTDPTPETFVFAAPTPSTVYDENPWQPFQPEYAPDFRRPGSLSSPRNSFFLPSNVLINRLGVVSDGAKNVQTNPPPIKNGSSTKIANSTTAESSPLMNITKNNKISDSSTDVVLSELSRKKDGRILSEKTPVTNKPNSFIPDSQKKNSPLSSDNESGVDQYNVSSEFRKRAIINEPVSSDYTDSPGKAFITPKQQEPIVDNNVQKKSDSTKETIGDPPQKSFPIELFKRINNSNTEKDINLDTFSSYLRKFSDLLKEQIASAISDTSTIAPPIELKQTDSDTTPNPTEVLNKNNTTSSPDFDQERIDALDKENSDDYIYYDTEFFAENSNLANIFNLISTKRPLALDTSIVYPLKKQTSDIVIHHKDESANSHILDKRSAGDESNVNTSSDEDKQKAAQDFHFEKHLQALISKDSNHHDIISRFKRHSFLRPQSSLTNLLSSLGFISVRSDVHRVVRRPTERPQRLRTPLLSERLFDILGWRNIVSSLFSDKNERRRDKASRLSGQSNFPHLQDHVTLSELDAEREERSITPVQDPYTWRKISVNRRGLINSPLSGTSHDTKRRFILDNRYIRPSHTNRFKLATVSNPETFVQYKVYGSGTNGLKTSQLQLMRPGQSAELESANETNQKKDADSNKLKDVTTSKDALLVDASGEESPSGPSPLSSLPSVSVLSSVSSHQSERLSVEVAVDGGERAGTSQSVPTTSITSTLASRLKNFTLTGCDNDGDGNCVTPAERCSSPLSRCDLISDCADGSDEMFCTCADHLRSHSMQKKLCDGVVDCDDHSDEQECEWCGSGKFICPGIKKCLDTNAICDGSTDCPDGADELHCLALADSQHSASVGSGYASSGYLAIRSRGEWGHYCADGFDVSAENTWANNFTADQLATYVCKHLTYGHAQEVFRVKSTMESEQPSRKQQFFTIDSLPEYGSNDRSISPKTSQCSSGNNLYIVCSNLQCGVRPKKHRRLSRVVGGSSTLPGDWPWNAAMFREGEYQCGATLISSQFLVSAAHCYIRSLSLRWVARLGSFRRGGLFLSPSEEVRDIASISIHPQYEDLGYVNDIAVLKLRNPAQLSDYVRPVCLPSRDWKVREGQMCTVVGWGQLFESGHIFPDTLQQVQLPVMSTAECQRHTRHLPLYRVTSGMFCAGMLRGGRDACLGDSGGPLMCQSDDGSWMLSGITSNGYGCARARRPGVYTKVANYLDWIEAVISGTHSSSKPAETCKGMRCPLGQCLSVDNICDGVVHCSDASDEIGCHIQS